MWAAASATVFAVGPEKGGKGGKVVFPGALHRLSPFSAFFPPGWEKCRAVVEGSHRGGSCRRAGYRSAPTGAQGARLERFRRGGMATTPMGWRRGSSRATLVGLRFAGSQVNIFEKALLNCVGWVIAS